MKQSAEEPPATMVSTSATGMDTAAAKSILVVDDEQNFVFLLDRVLTKRGYKVQTASNGEEALRLFEQEPFDLALIDIRMGPVDGLSLLGELKQRLPEIKAIMMTAYPTLDTRNRSFQKGAAAYFTKPVDLQKLVDTVHGLL